MKFAFWLTIAFACSLALPVAASSTDERDARFEKQVAAFAAGGDIVGLAVAVVRDGQPTLVRTYGPRELGGSEAVNVSTIFRIASLSKSFATSLVAQMVAEGKLKLDAHISDYAPDFRLKDENRLASVTLEHVMSHRLGLPSNAYDNLLESGFTPARILRRLGEVKPVCKVGQCYGYQNVAFNMLADVIESVDGRTVGEAMAERIFKPLGMETASVGMKGLKATGNWARPHRRRRSKKWRTVSVRPNWYRLPAAAGVNASITDMARWLAAQMGHAPDVLSPEMLAMLHKPRVNTPTQVRRYRHFLELDSAQYGLGWRIYKYRGETVISHTGSVDGYATQMTFLPDRKAGIVLLCNSRSQAFYQIVPSWLQEEVEPPVSPPPTAAAALAAQ